MIYLGVEGFLLAAGLPSYFCRLLSGGVASPRLSCDGLGIPSGFSSEIMDWFCVLFSHKLRMAKIDHCVISDKRVKVKRGNV